ncbi:MAG TPA: fumarylacetoacetate hydrolase family protein [Candidatus Methylomirabilis sp.]|nr:fumarylacetoacetate hydrolase family protein [Candidatus Methylomirabilis sp.]
MRLVTFEFQGRTRLGAEQDGGVVDLNRGYALLLATREVMDFQGQADRELPADMLGFLEGWDQSVPKARETLAFAREARGGGGPLVHAMWHPMQAVRLRAPILNPRKIICLGLNYSDHAKETRQVIPPEPALFSKYATSIIGPEEAILLPAVSQEVDFEAELAFIIARRGRRVSKAQALDYVAGYTVFHDVSARDYQLRKPGGQWMLGKTFDTFAPMGPVLVTREDLPDPHVLDISMTVSGEILQSSNTKNLAFTIQDIVAYCSHVFTLEPGDVIATGTPGGVGFARKPPRFLKAGDVAVVEIQGIGALRNPVRAEVE